MLISSLAKIYNFMYDFVSVSSQELMSISKFYFYNCWHVLFKEAQEFEQVNCNLQILDHSALSWWRLSITAFYCCIFTLKNQTLIDSHRTTSRTNTLTHGLRNTSVVHTNIFSANNWQQS